MQHIFGLNEYQYKQKNTRHLVKINTHELINSHLLITGMSGTGKSYQAKKLIKTAIEQSIDVDIFDVHNELNQSGTTSAIYSESTRLGYNLLTLSHNSHSGGIRRRINEIIAMINSTSRKLGSKQETALRNLLSDVYWLNGCYDNNPKSWKKDEITEEIRNRLLNDRNYQGLKQFYPTIDDLLGYADRKIKALYLGTNIKSVTALERVNYLANQLNKNILNQQKASHDSEKIQKSLDSAKLKVQKAFESYLENIETGRELSDIMKYNSKDVLQSVLERLNNLNSSGIFRPNPPSFGNTKGRCHQLKHLSDDEQKMFVYMRLETIFRKCLDSGVKSDLDHIVFLDEAHKFIVEDSSNIINVIAKEGRKFGLGLWCASQSPTHFSEDFLTNCGTTILLGIHSSYWDMACRKLQIDKTTLKYIRPKQSAAIKLQRNGAIESKFVNAIINESLLSDQ